MECGAHGNSLPNSYKRVAFENPVSDIGWVSAIYSMKYAGRIAVFMKSVIPVVCNTRLMWMFLQINDVLPTERSRKHKRLSVIQDVLKEGNTTEVILGSYFHFGKRGAAWCDKCSHLPRTQLTNDIMEGFWSGPDFRCLAMN